MADCPECHWALELPEETRAKIQAVNDADYGEVRQ
jgi:hypothetical protein